MYLKFKNYMWILKIGTFRFPIHDEATCRIWVQKYRRLDHFNIKTGRHAICIKIKYNYNNWNIYSSKLLARICDDHFVETDYDCTVSLKAEMLNERPRRRLLGKVIPTQNLPIGSCSPPPKQSALRQKERMTLKRKKNQFSLNSQSSL